MGQLITVSTKMMRNKVPLLLLVWIPIFTVPTVKCRATPQFGEITIPAVLIGGTELVELGEASFYSVESVEAAETADVGVQTVGRTSGWGRGAKFVGKAAAGGVIGSAATYGAVKAGCYFIRGREFCSN